MSGQALRRAPCPDCGRWVPHRLTDGGRFPHDCNGKYFQGDCTPSKPLSREKLRHELILWAEEQQRRLGASGYAAAQRRILDALLEKLGQPRGELRGDPDPGVVAPDRPRVK